MLKGNAIGACLASPFSLFAKGKVRFCGRLKE
jgi:hypothetical protein